MVVNSRIILTVKNINDAEQRKFSLEPHGRYSHSSVYVEQVFEMVGLSLESLEEVVLRNESGEDVLGYLVSGKCDGTSAY